MAVTAVNLATIYVLFKVGCIEMALALLISRTFARLRQGWWFRISVVLSTIIVAVRSSRHIYSENPLLNGRGAYDVLGISATASQKDIGRTYHMLAPQLHPDKIVGQADVYDAVLRSYETVKKPLSRLLYDKLALTDLDLSSTPDVVKQVFVAVAQSFSPYLQKLLCETLLVFASWTSVQAAYGLIVVFSVLHLYVLCYWQTWKDDPAFLCTRKFLLFVEVGLFLVNVNVLRPKQRTYIRNWQRPQQPQPSMVEVSRG